MSSSICLATRLAPHFEPRGIHAAMNNAPCNLWGSLACMNGGAAQSVKRRMALLPIAFAAGAQTRPSGHGLHAQMARQMVRAGITVVDFPASCTALPPQEPHKFPDLITVPVSVSVTWAFFLVYVKRGRFYFDHKRPMTISVARCAASGISRAYSECADPLWKKSQHSPASAR